MTSTWTWLEQTFASSFVYRPQPTRFLVTYAENLKETVFMKVAQWSNLIKKVSNFLSISIWIFVFSNEREPYLEISKFMEVSMKKDDERKIAFIEFRIETVHVFCRERFTFDSRDMSFRFMKNQYCSNVVIN